MCCTKEYQDSHTTFFGPDSVPDSASIPQAKNHKQCGGNGVNSTPEVKKTQKCLRSCEEVSWGL